MKLKGHGVPASDTANQIGSRSRQDNEVAEFPGPPLKALVYGNRILESADSLPRQLRRQCLAVRSLLLCFLILSFPAFGQKQERPEPYPTAQGEREARKIIDEILSQRPSEAPTNGTLRIRDAEGNERSLAVRMSILETKTNWTHSYETASGKDKSGDKLTIIHTFGKPNRYLFTRAGETTATELSGNQTMVPFAGSDFWVADLGLEFLHWPKQRAIKKEMRYHKACVMLESVNPHPATGAYARVESWLTIESPHAPVVARAYDLSGKQLKEFRVESVERIEGQYQLRSIELRDLKAKTRSVIEFDL